MTARRKKLVRLLASIDQELSLAEEMATESHDDADRQSALELMLEFQDAKRDVEAELKQLQ
jgi:hypothetical protein